MQKTYLLALSLIVLSFSQSHAQNNAVKTSKPTAHAMTAENNSGSPRVTIGTIETKITSREKVLAYPRLLVQELNCTVTGFSCSITANNKTYGPFKVKGAVFNDEIKDKVKELEAPPTVKISIDNITVQCNGGAEVAASPIEVEYDH